ncbi:MAG: FHA domain-containing protein [Planctomycetaceae bacterium]
MAKVTLHVLEGMERGRTFADLQPPVTIGREDDNSVRLNDERVSRFHAKIQEDGDSLILTDLESTNGTRVNGHPVQMRVLQVGDLLLIGRCLLVYGSPEEIARRLEESSSTDAEAVRDAMSRATGTNQDGAEPPRMTRAEESLDDEDLPLFPRGAPALPHSLFPVQRAQVSDVLAYIHEQIRCILETAEQLQSDSPQQGREAGKSLVIDDENWHRLLKLEMELAVYLRKIVDPDR